MKREELIKELEKMDDLDTMNKCADIILADRARLLAEVEEAVKPLREAVEESDRIGENERASVAWVRLDKATYKTLSALDKLKEG